MLQYQRPLHHCIFLLCENTAHGYINWPFASASKLDAVLSTSLKYRQVYNTMRPQICLQCARITVGRAMKKGQLAQKYFTFLHSG